MFFGLVKNVLPAQERAHTQPNCCSVVVCFTHTNKAANKQLYMHVAMNQNMQTDTVKLKTAHTTVLYPCTHTLILLSCEEP